MGPRASVTWAKSSSHGSPSRFSFVGSRECRRMSVYEGPRRNNDWKAMRDKEAGHEEAITCLTRRAYEESGTRACSRRKGVEMVRNRNFQNVGIARCPVIQGKARGRSKRNRAIFTTTLVKFCLDSIENEGECAEGSKSPRPPYRSISRINLIHARSTATSRPWPARVPLARHQPGTLSTGCTIKPVGNT